jgi:DNA-binding MarR family transcriptional regulator/N-acetylglutamate synthase-like GNAT family acetyltransferase
MAIGLERDIAAVRQFNRFYTRQIGVLEERLLETPFSLTESRVLYELANRPAPTASELAKDLGIDPGYLSRILRGFESRGFLARTPSDSDGRQAHLELTNAGREAFHPLDERSREAVAAMLHDLGAAQQQRLIAAMGSIEAALGARASGNAAYVLRAPRPGDMGWVVSRHGALYAEEYGWNLEFEGMVAEIVAAFVKNFDAARERCWITEIAGEPVGSVYVVEHSDEIAKLRLLLVEPHARGLGIGARLVDECIRFSRATGYKALTLWTNHVLHAARHIYERAGFRLVKEEKHRMFGPELIGQTWDLTL